MTTAFGLAAFTSLALLASAATAETPAQGKAAVVTQRTLAAVSAVQELPPFAADEMERRRAEIGDEDALAADASLNAWKLCVLDAVVRWQPLKAGPGTVADGAFGRCGDIERYYRDSLARMTQDGRAIVDLQMAKAMARSLEETWRPKIVAAVLDQQLAEQARP